MTALKKTKKPRKPNLAQPWVLFGPKLVNYGDLLLQIHATGKLGDGTPVVTGTPSQMRKLAKTLLAWADWSDVMWESMTGKK
mgnify:CR=1 FL=1